VTPAGQVRSLTADLPASPGRYDVGPDGCVALSEPRQHKLHTHVRGVWPPDTAVEEGFAGGPVFAFRLEDAVADAATGAIWDKDGLLVREAFGTAALTERFLAQADPPPLTDAVRVAEPFVPLATTRSANYCRWWLDSMGKLFVAERSGLGGARPTSLAHGLTRRFQRDAMLLLDDVRLLGGEGPRFFRGTVIGSPGLTFGGGQHVGELVTAFAAELGTRARSHLPRARGAGPRIYVSRRRAPIRRVEDEEALTAALGKLGFVSVELEKLSLASQAAAFAEAEVVLAPHGAGLTNLLWAGPHTTLIEMFPEGGLHGSAFLRIASQLGLPYYAIVGGAGEQRGRKPNPNNADIRIDVEAVMPFIEQAVASAH